MNASRYQKIREAVRMNRCESIPECDAQQQQGPDYTFTEAMKVCEDGLRVWREKPHNKRWWKRIDGTPIPNDLLCCIAEALAAHRKGGSVPAPEQPDVSGYTCTVPDDCETLHWRGQILSMNELASVAQPAEGEEIMVNTPYDVFILPLQPSGLSSSPRFVVHVPGPEAQAVKELQAKIEALRAEVERLNQILGRIVEGDGDSTVTICAGADAFAAAREYLITTGEVRGYANSRANAAIAAQRERLGETANDLTRCPNCGGPADNGHDREVPPNPYWCSKCMES